MVAKLFVSAVKAGAKRTSMVRIEWDISGDCQCPNIRELFAQPPPDRGRKTLTLHDGEKVEVGSTKWSRWATVTPEKGINPLMVELTSPCRHCDKCLRRRSMIWTYRARAEVAAATRTWFGTLTLRPEEQYRALALARQALDRQGIDYDLLSFAEQFKLRHQVVSAELTKTLKRIRKNSGATLRYLMVAEAHMSGLPHYHILVHECDDDERVTHKVLSAAWKLGFSKFKLVTDPRAATYLCKYLSKSAAARVRASKHYGQMTSLADRREGVVKSDPKIPPAVFGLISESIIGS